MGKKGEGRSLTASNRKKRLGIIQESHLIFYNENSKYAKIP